MERILLRVEEAAEAAGLSRATMYELVLGGVVPSIKVGRARRIPREALVAWVHAQLAERTGEGPTAAGRKS